MLLAIINANYILMLMLLNIWNLNHHMFMCKMYASKIYILPIAVPGISCTKKSILNAAVPPRSLSTGCN